MKFLNLGDWLTKNANKYCGSMQITQTVKANERITRILRPPASPDRILESDSSFKSSISTPSTSYLYGRR